jgi:hypothetical protein
MTGRHGRESDGSIPVFAGSRLTDPAAVVGQRPLSGWPELVRALVCLLNRDESQVSPTLSALPWCPLKDGLERNLEPWSPG